MKQHYLSMIKTNAVHKLFLPLLIFISFASFGQDTVIIKQHTASVHVHIIDTAFFMPQLNRSRRIWIYLPEGYNKTAKRYPVLYMHDGQDLFDELTSAYGEWGVDESLDSMIAKGTPACIVVGIDNNDQNSFEYDPFYNKTYDKKEGDLYLDFLVHTLKPFIDGHYSTMSSKENTIIAGSNMGGLISYYAMLRHPNVFGKAGIFSPVAMFDSIKQQTDISAKKVTGKIFFYMGGNNGNTHLDDYNEVVEKIGTNSDAMIYTLLDPDAMNKVKDWKKWFPGFYSWIMADGFNNVIKLETP